MQFLLFVLVGLRCKNNNKNNNEHTYGSTDLKMLQSSMHDVPYLTDLEGMWLIVSRLPSLTDKGNTAMSSFSFTLSV